jgi:hypothetical protein
MQDRPTERLALRIGKVKFYEGLFSTEIKKEKNRLQVDFQIQASMQNKVEHLKENIYQFQLNSLNGVLDGLRTELKHDLGGDREKGGRWCCSMQSA